MNSKYMPSFCFKVLGKILGFVFYMSPGGAVCCSSKLVYGQGLYLSVHSGKRLLQILYTPSPKDCWKPNYRMRNLTESRNSKEAIVVVLVAFSVATDLT
jgi:hypothetical protein